MIKTSALSILLSLTLTTPSLYASDTPQPKMRESADCFGEVSVEDLYGGYRCFGNAVMGVSILNNLYKIAQDWGSKNSNNTKHVVGMSGAYLSNHCYGEFSKSIAKGLFQTSVNGRKVSLDAGPKEFLLSLAKIQRERLNGKTFKKDFAPDLAGAAYKRAIKDSDSTLLKDLSSPVKVFTKFVLNSDLSEKEATKEYNGLLNNTFLCGNSMIEVLNSADNNSFKLIKGLMKSAKTVNGVKSKFTDKLLYVDLISLAAMNGGELGKKIIEETIKPRVGIAKEWSLSQKAKAAQFGLKMKSLFSKAAKDHQLAIMDGKSAVFDAGNSLVGKGKELAVLSQRELQLKIDKANLEMKELNDTVNDLIRDGQDIQAPSHIKNIATTIQLRWAQVRLDRDRQIQIIKKKTLALLCKTPDKLLSQEQLMEKNEKCLEEEKTKKKGLIQRFKEKATALFKINKKNQ